MGAVGAGKGVVHVKLGIDGKLGSKIGIIGLLAGVKAQIFKQYDSARLHTRHGLRRRLADTIFGEGHRRASQSLA